MAKIDLGRITPTYRGDYDSTVSYNELDIVYDDTIGKSFIAKQASKGKDLPIDKENEYWGIIAKQGPKGNTGEVGPKGDKGAAGDQGIQGERGPKGDKGDQGPRGPQGIQGDQGVAGNDATFDENKDYTFNGSTQFETPIKGEFEYFNQSDYNILSENRKLNTKPISRIGSIKLHDLSNTFGLNNYQEIIVDPRSGYRYGFINLDIQGTDKTTENLGIAEYDQYLRVRSTMKVIHGTNKKSWLHGQFCQFNYYNKDKDKVEFLIGGYGESVKLEYIPDSTVSYDDLPVFFTVNETQSMNQSIDFDNNRVISALLEHPAPGNTTYTFNFYMYDLDPELGKTTFNKKYSYTKNIPNNYVSQGISMAPAKDYIGRESDGSMIFCTSGGTNLDTGIYIPGSLQMFLVENGSMTLYADLENLYDLSPISSSQSRLSDSKGYQEFDISYKEIEGSSQTKINGKWVFTTNLIYGRDVNRYKNQEYLQRNGEQMQLGFGDLETLLIYKHMIPDKRDTFFTVDSYTTRLVDIIQPGIYEVSSSLLPYLEDCPFILSGDNVGSMSNILGGTGVDSIKLEVEQVGSHGRVHQKLTINTYSYMNYEDISFSRYVRPDVSFGTPYNPTAGRWKLQPNYNVGNWITFPLSNKSTLLNVPGINRFITATQTDAFFKDDNIHPTSSGMFETLPQEVPLENGNTSTRIMQRFTTYDYGNIKIWQRVLNVPARGDLTVYPQGIGGGYGTPITIGDWNVIV